MADKKEIWDQIIEEALKEENKEDVLKTLKDAKEFLVSSGNKELAKKFELTIAKIEKGQNMADKETIAALYEQDRIIKLINQMSATIFFDESAREKLIGEIRKTGP